MFKKENSRESEKVRDLTYHFARTPDLVEEDRESK